MNKNSQRQILISSLKEGYRNECLSFIECIKFKDIFEYHIQEDYDNGVYNKLSDEEIESIISDVEDSIGQVQIKVMSKKNIPC
jgi:hypothetical protein